MNQSECFNLGNISKIVGFKGELALLLDVDSPEKYKNLELVFIELNQQLIPFFIKKINLKGNIAIVQLEGVDTIEKAKELVKSKLYLPLSQLPPLKGKKFYFHEVIGFKVVDKTYGDIGTIETILDFPSQRIFQIKKENKEILIPVKSNFIIKIDRDNNTVEIDAPEGLIDIYLGKQETTGSEDDL